MQRPSSNPSGFLRPSLWDLAFEPWERGSGSVQAHLGLLARGLGSCGREELGGKVRKPMGCGDERLGSEVYLAHLGPDGPQPHIEPELLGTPGVLTLAAGDFAGLPAGFRASQPARTAGWKSPCWEARPRSWDSPQQPPRDPVLRPASFLFVYLGGGTPIPLAGDKQN